MKKVLTAFVVLILGLTGCGDNQGGNAQQSARSSTAPVASQTSRYTWTAEGLSFEHPNSWTNTNPLVSPEQAKQQPALSPDDPVAAFYSPDIMKVPAIGFSDVVREEGTYTGGFAVVAQLYKPDEFTGIDAPDVRVRKVIPIQVPGYKRLSIVELGTGDSHTSRLALTDAPVIEGSLAAKPHDTFASKKTPGARVSISTGILAQEEVAPQTFAFASTSTNTFENSTGYQTAIDILKSVSYE